MKKSPKSLGAVALALGAGTLLALAPAAAAFAHTDVVESTPAEGEVLTSLPEAWEVVTNEAMLSVGNDAVFGLWARDADGLYYGDGCVEVDGSRMSAAPVIGEAGSYTLVYALISEDGHPLSGEIPFEWAPSSASEVATGSAEPARCGAEAPAEPSAAPVSADVWWIAAGVGAVGVAVITTVLLTRRRRESRDDPAA
jgi:methionine-rich copper-binding protein CopC